MKPEKANSIVDFLSRQRGQEAVEDVSAKFPDDFPEAGVAKAEEMIVFHISGGEGLEF